MKTPKPKTVSVVCDVCGLDWKQHKPIPKGKTLAGTVSLEECVRLLKVKCDRLRAAPRMYANTVSGTTGSGIRIQ